MRNPFKVGGFEKRLFLIFLLFSIPPTLVIAFFSARYFMQSVRLVSNPGVEQSFSNSMEIARDLSNKMEDDAGCISSRLGNEYARTGAVGARLADVLAAVAQETHADFTAVYDWEGSSWVMTASYPAGFKRIDTSISPASLVSPSSEASSPSDAADPRRVAFSDPDVIAQGVVSDGRLFVAGFALELGFAERIRGTADDLSRYRAVGLYVNVVRRSILIVTSVLVVIAAVASALLSRLLAGRISYPITELARATEQVAKGDLKYRVNVAAPDEVASLVAGFNKMTEELEENRDNIVAMAKREAEVARDLAIARQVQESLFPTSLPLIPGWEFAATCRTARLVGGDYYDVFEIAPGKVLFAQGDVMGKSVGASLTMASVHAIVRSVGVALGKESTPSELMQELNRYLLSSKTPEMFVTLFLGLIDVEKGKLTYVNAGHPPGLMLRQGTRQALVELSVGGLVLGVGEGAQYDTGEREITSGDSLVLVSDGVTEAVNLKGDMYGAETLADLLSSADSTSADSPSASARAARSPSASESGLGAMEIMQRILDSVDAFSDGVPQTDDISILVLKRAF